MCMLAIVEAKNAGLLKQQFWLQNIISGIIVGIVALPLAMAFAIASGVKPEQGIYTAIIAGFFVSVFGGSRVQIAGPTGAFIVVLSGITAKYGVQGLQIATLMAGGMLILMGMTKMGAVIRYIPDPVIVGFTAGIGIIIWVGQWTYFLGLPEISGEHFHSKLFHLFQVLPDFDSTTALLAIGSLLIVVYAPRIYGLKKVPSPLIALILATAAQYIFEFETVKTIGTAFGGIPQTLPQFILPTVNVERVIELIGPAFTIAMLGAIESLLSAVVADGMTGGRHDSNQELVGQGIANLITPLFGGFAATGAIARTATNIRNGGNSPLSGIIHSVTLLIIILVLAPLALYIPLAVLAAILFVVAWNMSDVKKFRKIVHHAPKADVAILLITFFLTIFADLVVAVNIGVILATLHFLRRMATSVEVRQVTETEITKEISQHTNAQLPSNFLVLAVDGPLFFGAVENFERAITNTDANPEYLNICLKRVPFIDATGLQSLEEVIHNLHKRNITVILSEANELVLSKLCRAGIIELVGEKNNYHTLADAYAAVCCVKREPF